MELSEFLRQLATHIGLMIILRFIERLIGKKALKKNIGQSILQQIAEEDLSSYEEIKVSGMIMKRAKSKKTTSKEFSLEIRVESVD